MFPHICPSDSWDTLTFIFTWMCQFQHSEASGVYKVGSKSTQKLLISDHVTVGAAGERMGVGGGSFPVVTAASSPEEDSARPSWSLNRDVGPLLVPDLSGLRI